MKSHVQCNTIHVYYGQQLTCPKYIHVLKS